MSLLWQPKRLSPGDRVAIVSPSAGLPAVFPHVYELGLRRLRDVFGLVPVEYPTTRAPSASPAERARDLMAAFADPDVAAVVSSIGGDDQITVLRHLDPTVLRANPKPFLGYSDNTNLLNYLYFHGIGAWHGGSVMVQLGRSRALHPTTEASWRAALFSGGDHVLTQADRYADLGWEWGDPANLDREPWSRPAAAWAWHGREARVRGRLWGGNLEILDWTLQVGRYVHDAEQYRGCVLFLETSEELPSATYVFRTLRNLGERGILGAAAAVIVGRPTAQALGTPATDAEVATFVADQRDAVLRALAEYNPGVPTVLGVEAGHTDPQELLPYGGEVTVDTARREVIAHYG